MEHQGIEPSISHQEQGQLGTRVSVAQADPAVKSEPAILGNPAFSSTAPSFPAQSVPPVVYSKPWFRNSNTGIQASQTRRPKIKVQFIFVHEGRKPYV